MHIVITRFAVDSLWWTPSHILLKMYTWGRLQTVCRRASASGTRQTSATVPELKISLN